VDNAAKIRLGNNLNERKKNEIENQNDKKNTRKNN
jgi:hypothetical protein